MDGTKEELVSLKPLTHKIDIQQLKNSDVILNHSKSGSVKFLCSGKLLQILATICGEFFYKGKKKKILSLNTIIL